MRPILIVALSLAVGGSFPAMAADEFALLKAEQIGPLRIGLPAGEVARGIACQPRRGPVARWEADGDYHQEWAYPDCGIRLDMSATTPKGAWTIGSITLTRPSPWKTRRGIGIGSTEREVMAAYGRDRSAEDSAPGKNFVAGSVYGGLMLTFEGGRVARIFLGAAAE
ncbi:MAG: hypothetical protein P9G45_15240 [Candidatus Contendobacter sp.]|nr:hypothetical protein [Candidatus Contendobacter sp.]